MYALPLLRSNTMRAVVAPELLPWFKCGPKYKDAGKLFEESFEESTKYKMAVST